MLAVRMNRMVLHHKLDLYSHNRNLSAVRILVRLADRRRHTLVAEVAAGHMVHRTKVAAEVAAGHMARRTKAAAAAVVRTNRMCCRDMPMVDLNFRTDMILLVVAVDNRMDLHMLMAAAAARIGWLLSVLLELCYTFQ